MRKSLTIALGALTVALWALPAQALTAKVLTDLGLKNTPSTASIKTSSGTLYGYAVAASTTSVTPMFLQFFNSKASVLGTAIPVLEFPIAASGSVQTFPMPIFLGGTALTAGLSTYSHGSATASGNVTILYQ